MAQLVFGMNQSLDGYLDHTAFARRALPSFHRRHAGLSDQQAHEQSGQRVQRIDAHPVFLVLNVLLLPKSAMNRRSCGHPGALWRPPVRR
ncbi:MAG: hypothetical protein JO320_13885 [Alphaproteobacteria bacterium]|nr:hypothetical protein [Acetobacteraceae bacterium]MBV9376123.1 hypothetical protein [Alphaproteobacteria bacterium]